MVLNWSGLSPKTSAFRFNSVYPEVALFCARLRQNGIRETGVSQTQRTGAETRDVPGVRK